MAVAIVQALDRGAPSGAGATLSWGVAPTPGNRLFVLLVATVTTANFASGPAGWARVVPGPMGAGDGSGHTGAAEIWTKVATAAADGINMTWNLNGSMELAYLLELSGAGAVSSTPGTDQGGADQVGPILTLTPGALAGLAIGLTVHGGGIHSGPGNDNIGDYLAAGSAAFTVRHRASTFNASALVGTAPFAAAGPAVSWQGLDFHPGNGTWGAVLVLVAEDAGRSFAGEPGGSIW